MVAINSYCTTGPLPTREAIQQKLNDVFKSIQAAVGTDGRVRRAGSMPVYPMYNSECTEEYGSDLNVTIRITNLDAAQRILEAVEAMGCGSTWDVRLVDVQDFELALLEELSQRLDKRKTVFEKLLNTKLNKILGVSIQAFADGYGTYDPEANIVETTTVLSVNYDITSPSSRPASSA